MKKGIVIVLAIVGIAFLAWAAGDLKTSDLYVVSGQNIGVINSSGTVTDADLITLTNDNVVIAGTLSATTGADGVDDTTAGTRNVYGGSGTTGGTVNVYAGASVNDDSTNYWSLDTDTATGNLQLRGLGGTVGTGTVFTVDDAAGRAVTITPDVAMSGAATVGGGFGSSGVTLSSAGAISADGGLIIKGVGTYGVADTSAGSVTLYGNASTGGGAVTVENGAGVDDETDTWSWDTSTGGDLQLRGIGGTVGTAVLLTVDDDAGRLMTITPNLALTSTDVGGGYGSTGATVSAAGVGQFNGALTTDGALTALSGAFSGGYGTTGTTIADGGALSTDGAAILGSTLAVTGAATFNSASGDVDTIFNGDNAEVMRVDASTDRVGIGTAGPATKFQVAGDDLQITILDTASSATSNTAIGIVCDDGASLANGDKIGYFYWRGSRTSSLQATGAAIDAFVDGSDWTSTSAPTSLVFRVVPTGSLTTATALTISQNKLVTAADDLTVTDVLTVNGNTTLGNSATDTVDHPGVVTVGDGYGSTGATFSTAGVGQFNGALTTDGALTSDTVVVGGGYGSTGATIATTGAISTNSTLQVDSTTTHGVSGSARGIIAMEDGAGGNTPSYITLSSRNGTQWHLFVEDDGTVKVMLNAPATPTDNADGDPIGAQID